MDWFTVDKAGLAKLLEKKGKAFAVYELLQNAWDAGATRVEAVVEPMPSQPLVRVWVEDDSPDGFKDLTHAFTLFAESEKKGDPTKRGRFNLGEKLVLALCQEARIESTTGTVTFEAEGRRTSRYKRERGSMFSGVMRMTREELADLKVKVDLLIPPVGCETIFNDEPIEGRHLLLAGTPPHEHLEATLPTEAADEEGVLRRTERKTSVTLHQCKEGETAMLYEMGIPVVELEGGDPWHINVHQKVPLNMDRDNVTPAFLRTLRVNVANYAHNFLDKNDANALWLEEATSDKRSSSQAVDAMLTLKFGPKEKRAILDPNDPEANNQLHNEGFTVIPGGALSKQQWALVKQHQLAAPSGHIRPSSGMIDMNKLVYVPIEPAKYTEGQRAKVAYAKDLGQRLLNLDILVEIIVEPQSFPATWSRSRNLLTLNLGRLGKEWFNRPLGCAHHELFLHEFAHAKVGNHLTHEFSNEVARLFAILVDLALIDPDFFRHNGYQARKKHLV